MSNIRVRQALRNNFMTQWELAKHLGISEFTLCRRLRTELTEETQNQYIQIIEEEAKKRYESK